MEQEINDDFRACVIYSMSTVCVYYSSGVQFANCFLDAIGSLVNCFVFKTPLVQLSLITWTQKPCMKTLNWALTVST